VAAETEKAYLQTVAGTAASRRLDPVEGAAL
jgi:hypothetical protein